MFPELNVYQLTLKTKITNGFNSLKENNELRHLNENGFSNKLCQGKSWIYTKINILNQLRISVFSKENEQLF